MTPRILKDYRVEVGSPDCANEFFRNVEKMTLPATQAVVA